MRKKKKRYMLSMKCCQSFEQDFDKVCENETRVFLNRPRRYSPHLAGDSVLNEDFVQAKRKMTLVRLSEEADKNFPPLPPVYF